MDETVIEISDSSSNKKSLDDEEEEEKMFIKNVKKASKKRKISSSTKNKKSRKSTAISGADEHEKGGKNTRRRQRLKYYQSSGSEDDDTGKEDDDTDKKDDDIDKEPISEYEKLLEEKRAEKTELLKKLGIDKVTAEYSEAVKSMEKKKIKTPVEKSEVPAVRRSSGRSKPTINYAEKELQPNLKGLQNAQTFKDVLKSDRLCKDFARDFSDILEPDASIEQKPMLYDENVLEQLSATASTNRILSPSVVSWYPSAVNLILAVGTTAGSLSLWNIKEDKFDLHTFIIHKKKITNLQFNPFNSLQMVTSSSDGTLLCCDMQKQIFSEILKISKGNCTYFDFFSPSSYIVSLSDGQIVILDKNINTQGEGEKRHTCHDSPINTINVHPVDRNYFVTTAAEKTVRLWDLRKLTATPVIDVECSLYKFVHSAFFSPVSGKFLLTTSPDETVRVLDGTNLTKGVQQNGRIYVQHYKILQYSSSSPQMRAVWLPNSDEKFAFSHRAISPGIQIYDKDLNCYGKVKDGMQKGIRIHHIFHPFRSALASCPALHQDENIYVHT